MELVEQINLEELTAGQKLDLVTEGGSRYRLSVSRQPEHIGANLFLGFLMSRYSDHGIGELPAAEGQYVDVPSSVHIHTTSKRGLLQIGRNVVFRPDGDADFEPFACSPIVDIQFVPEENTDS